MKATTMLDTIQSLLGTPMCAIPLSCCQPAMTYLLERAGIPRNGTAILFAVPYVLTADVTAPRRNLSLYAVPRDYHGYMKELKAELLPALLARYPAYRFALFSDHSPIREVNAAARAGLGVLGRNGLLITPMYGSLVFLGELVTDADYTAVTGNDIPNFPTEPPLCEGCGACVAACPVGCCGRDDRSNCLSALTQKKGELTPMEQEAMLRGGLVWGCDACQLACPHNIRILREGHDTPIPYFRKQRFNQLTVETLDGMDDRAFASRAYSWRGRQVIRRNLILWEQARGGSKT